MAIDRKKIISQMSQIEILPDENGIIEGFNVLVNQLPTTFWNSFAERLTSKSSEEMLESKEYLLYNAAHECGYHTGYGIITSDEWNAVVKPMVEKVPEDILHGAFAVFTAWGWADSEIVELIPGEKMVVRAYDYYETDIVRIGASRKLSSYLIAGVCAAFMELAYAGAYDPSGKAIGTYECRQVKGIECGDSYGEFIVTRA
ncbi:MAG: hypothetical protein CVV64_17155 [Candidatus Wallbacteria bacterium HGW-Wallbacteria-1]|jgi:hypothetical protein|uniref:4-vinyl reductase 4VR domain-containing protein n=1 Tax=Candidatus Wallbacteria bacterium HGW-Wallbacteria-1 TaxID=2013854 RepID=A0A2N1PKK5_9BACT|nr:MAG: hypothetical protein CVV64_17155 [Candidatus Wallbacteria bacterium HGW-Wallbacteria-1]